MSEKSSCLIDIIEYASKEGEEEGGGRRVRLPEGMGETMQQSEGCHGIRTD